VGEFRRVMNSSRGSFDAFRTTITSRNGHGLSMEYSSWFSNAIDLGGDCTNTAHNVDSFRFRSQGEFDVSGNMRGLSRFDSPHPLLIKSGYRIPPRPLAGRFRNALQNRHALQPHHRFRRPGLGNVDGISGDRPNLVDAAVLGRTISQPDLSRSQLPRSAFSYIQPGEERGNLGRHTFRRATFRNGNAGLTGQ
jgi:hypothetical protein